ncbi:MAG: lasso peptide biosynthesis B2 protein [Gemmatimonadales bacterium]
MRTLGRFLRLAARDRRLVRGAVLAVAATRLGLWLLPFTAVRRLIPTLARPAASERRVAPAPVARIAWAVATAGRRVPGGANCLVQAIAAHVLLAREGYRSRLHIGVARDTAGGLAAHAWLERHGALVLGGPVAARFTPLALFGDD